MRTDLAKTMCRATMIPPLLMGSSTVRYNIVEAGLTNPQV